MTHPCMAEMGNAYTGPKPYRPCGGTAKGVRDVPPLLVCGVHLNVESVRRNWSAKIDLDAVPLPLFPDLLRHQQEYAKGCWERAEHDRRLALRADAEAIEIENRILAETRA